jgi:hypothetical protein
MYSSDADPNKRNFIKKATNICVGGLQIVFGILIYHRRYENTDVLKKYLGSEYSPDFERKYSLIISNHMSWIVYRLKIGYNLSIRILCLWFYGQV